MAKRILILVAVLSLTTMAFATESRIGGMNVQSWMTSDDTNIVITPSNILSYKQLVVGELGNTSATTDDNMTVNMNMGPGVMGLTVGNWATGWDIAVMNKAMVDYLWTAGTPGGSSVPYIMGTGKTLGIIAPQSRVKAIYGMGFDQLGLGLGVEYFSYQEGVQAFETVNGYSAQSSEAASSLCNIMLGATLPLAVIDPLEVGVTIGMPSFSISSQTGATTAGTASTSGMMLDLGIRAKMSELLAKDTATYFVIGFNSDSTEAGIWTNSVKTRLKTVKGSGFTVGMSNNHKIADNSLLICALYYANSTTEIVEKDIAIAPSTVETSVTGKKTTDSMPIHLALETKAAPWLTVRGGSSSSMVKQTKNEVTVSAVPVADRSKDTGVMNTSEQIFSLGATWGITERLDLDIVANEAFLFNGPFFVSGQAAALAGKVSASYRF